jgi:hypothetical protein
MGLRGDATTAHRRVARSLTDLLGREVGGELLTGGDGKTGARLERVTVDGRRYVLKYLHLEDDWVMRATGDLEVRAVTVWRDGWLDRLPPAIDHAVVGAARDDRPDRQGAVLVMHDVDEHLVPEGDHELPLERHHAFIRHMAGMHVAFWGHPPTGGLLPLSTRLVFFGPRLGSTERARGGTDPVPTQLVPEGWSRLADRAPRASAVLSTLLEDPTPLLAGLTATPQTFVHGDWKAGNLGARPDGRTILLDWAIPGIAPGAIDLAWYVCLNRARLPETKEAAFEVYREALERHGIDTSQWWDQQLTLCLLAIMLMFGWEKALGDGDELSWWEDRVLAGDRWLAS